MMTFAQFQATGRDVSDLGEVIRDCGLEGQAGRVYAGDAFINCDALICPSWRAFSMRGA